MIFKYTLIHYKFLTISTWRRPIFPAIVISKCGEIHVLDKIMCFSHFGEIHAFFTHFGEIHAFFTKIRIFIQFRTFQKIPYLTKSSSRIPRFPQKIPYLTKSSLRIPRFPKNFLSKIPRSKKVYTF